MFDVAIIGGGPGGYVCAIKAAQLGLKTICIEKRRTLGGTCLNVGCIPSKALLHSTEKYHFAKHHAADHGLTFTGLGVDLAALMRRKDKVVADLTKGIEFLFKKNGVTHMMGTGTLLSPTSVNVTKADGSSEVVSAKKIVLATGSESMPLPGVTVDEEVIVTSTGALSLPQIPQTMAVIGGGYIGLEMASVWQRLGTQVTVVEYLPRLTPTLDGEVAKQLHKNLEKLGVTFRLSTKVGKVERQGKAAVMTLEPAAGGAPETLQVDVVLLAIGRRPYTENLGLTKVGVTLDDKKRVVVDEHFQTTVPTIYAIGDIIRGPMLAHKAEEEGVALAEILAGKAGHVNYAVIPAVVYTWPEVASCGVTEEELQASGIAYKIGKFPFTANSRARANGDTDGFVKILADATTDTVLGAHIIGPDAGTMIGAIAAVMEFGGSSEDISRTCHAHPTLSEAIKEAALAVTAKPLHA